MNTDGVTVICYGRQEYWNSRADAAAFYREGWLFTSPSAESERYARIFAEIRAGLPVCTDGSPLRTEKNKV